jgi:hypothetical protein
VGLRAERGRNAGRRCRRPSSGAESSEGCPCLLCLSGQGLSGGDFGRRVAFLPSLQHSRPGFGPLKPGCDTSGIRGMLTVGRNLVRTGQQLSTYLCYSDLSKLILIFSHLFLLYSDYSYLFILKDKCGFHTLKSCA